MCTMFFVIIFSLYLFSICWIFPNNYPFIRCQECILHCIWFMLQVYRIQNIQSNAPNPHWLFVSFLFMYCLSFLLFSIWETLLLFFLKSTMCCGRWLSRYSTWWWTDLRYQNPNFYTWYNLNSRCRLSDNLYYSMQYEQVGYLSHT